MVEILLEKLTKCNNEIAQLEITKAEIEERMRFAIAKKAAYTELIDEFAPVVKAETESANV